MYWQTLNFGRYKNTTLPQVVLHDPKYFFSGIKARVFEGRGIDMQVRHLDHRARNIKIPKPYEKSGASIMTLSPVLIFFTALGLCTAWLWKDSTIRLCGNRLVIWICQLFTAITGMTRSRTNVCLEILNFTILEMRKRTCLGSNVTSFLNAMKIFTGDHVCAELVRWNVDAMS